MSDASSLIQQLFASPVFQAFAGGASIVSLLWAILVFLRSKRQRLYLSTRRSILFNSNSIPFQGVALRFQSGTGGSLVEANKVVRDLILLYNNTNSTVTEADFAVIPLVELGHDLMVFEKSIHTGNSLGTARFEQVDQGFRLVDIVLPPGHGLVLEIIHNDNGYKGLRGMPRMFGSFKESLPTSAFGVVFALVWFYGGYLVLGAGRYFEYLMPFPWYVWLMPLLGVPVGMAIQLLMTKASEKEFDRIFSGSS